MKHCIVEFNNVDEAIKFAKEYWPEQALNDAEEMQRTTKEELAEEVNKGWCCLIGVCDICSYEQIIFIPAVAEIFNGLQCADCDNMSVYPKEDIEDN